MKKKIAISRLYSLIQFLKHLFWKHTFNYIPEEKNLTSIRQIEVLNFGGKKVHAKSKSTCEKRRILSRMLTTASPEVGKPTLCPSKMTALEKLCFDLFTVLSFE